MGTMLGLARFAALGVLFALAGCVTTENSLSQNDIAGMKLTGVTVSFAPEAGIQWEDGIRAYATSKAIPDHEIATATNTPEGKAYVRDQLAPRIKAGVEQAMAGRGDLVILGLPSGFKMGFRSGPIAGVPNSTRHIRQFPATGSLG